MAVKEINIEKTLNKQPSKLEEKVLKAIFKRENALVDVADIINSNMFTISEYSSIYQAMLDIFKEGNTITPETVQIKLESSGVSVDNKILQKLYNESYTCIKVEETALMMKEIYQRRFVLQNLREILEQQEDKPTGVNAILDQINTVTIKSNEMVSNGSVTAKCCDDANEIMVDVLGKLSGKVENGGLQTGFNVIDRNLNGMKRGNLWCVCADSQVGKSMFALELVLNICERQPDIHALYYSLEMTKKEQEIRGLGMILDIEPEKIDNPKKYFMSFDRKSNTVIDTSKDPAKVQEYTAKIRQGIDKLRGYNLFIDETPDHTSTSLEASIRKHHLRFGKVDLIVVDHMNILCSGTVSDEVGKLKEGYAMLKKIAKKYNCVVICLHQFSNELKNDELRKPNIFNIIGGSSARHFSDVICCIWRPGIYREVVDKHPELKDHCDLTWQKVRGAKKPDPTLMSYNGYMFKEKEPSDTQGEILNGEIYINSDGELVRVDD